MALVQEISRDLWLGLRSLLRSPRFTVPAVLVLALGLGVNAVLMHLFFALRSPSDGIRDHASWQRVRWAVAGQTYALTGKEGAELAAQTEVPFSAVITEVSVGLRGEKN